MFTHVDTLYLRSNCKCYSRYYSSSKKINPMKGQLQNQMTETHGKLHTLLVLRCVQSLFTVLLWKH